MSLSALSLFGILLPFALAQSSDDGSSGSDPLGIGSKVSDSDDVQAPGSNDGDKPLYFIILVVVVIIAAGFAGLCIVRRRRRRAMASRSRITADVEAARMQHGLTNWRTTGNWHSSARGSIPLASPLSPPLSSSSPTTARRQQQQQQQMRTPPPPRVEGLNEDGEAPPPYAPPMKGDKELHVGVDRRDSGTSATETALGSPTGQLKDEDIEMERPPPVHRRD